METLRTPDDRFVDLPDYDFAPHYAEIPDGDGGTLRVHYLDEGPRDGSIVLLLHGEPSWCYLYRHMIPLLTDAGHRVIAPDQVGFGRSDKPSKKSDYTYQRHVDWMASLVFDHLDINDATFFGQDWGGLIGLRLVAAQPDRFARVVISNTGLPDGDAKPSKAFLDWQHFSQTADEFPIGAIIGGGGVVTPLSEEVIAAYNAPFPSDEFTMGARIWPSLVPTSPNDPAVPANKAAWAVFDAWEKPFLCCFSDQDPVTAGGDMAFIERVPGAAGQPHTTIEGGGHFVQEDKGPELAQIIIDFMAAG